MESFGANGPHVSVILPARNEGPRLTKTIESIAESRARRAGTWVEVVVVDDASTEGHVEDVTVSEARLTIKVIRSSEQLGVPQARNMGAAAATAPILFMTDAHVDLSKNWDEHIFRTIKPMRVLAITIADPTSQFRGYGCSLVVPFMGTRWNREVVKNGGFVHVPSAAGTVLTRKAFERMGGYDSGMLKYGAAEPEFGVRAWLSGAEVISVPEVIVWHRFKSRPEIRHFLRDVRPSMVHNALRFGLLYLSDRACLQMVRHYAQEFPDHMPQALRMLSESDVWDRRERLGRSLRHDFRWFVDRFKIRDQAGGEILC
jgi:glycosyltransferase involved in cell wall biosynthesis